jgi:hypothetical protein
MANNRKSGKRTKSGRLSRAEAAIAKCAESFGEFASICHASGK